MALKKAVVPTNRKNILSFTFSKCIVYFGDFSRVWKTQEYTGEMWSLISIAYDIVAWVNKQATITITTTKCYKG